jgi:hypothetical protein
MVEIVVDERLQVKVPISASTFEVVVMQFELIL